MNVPFNRPYLGGKEITYIEQALHSNRLSGDGQFTHRCHRWLEERFQFDKVFLTTSCTHALEMAALLVDIQPGDEVIIPSYTFVSTANAFRLRGAKIIFADSLAEHPSLDVAQLERHITPKTKAVVPVHYAGVACDMDLLKSLAEKYQLWIIEDAAQAINAFYKGQALGSLGDMGCFSFHDTKNIVCGEGGMISINRKSIQKKAEIIREKGTNRAAFYRGEVNKYGWIDIGSSYLPSDVLAAFLLAQLKQLDHIQALRSVRWKRYMEAFHPLQEQGKFQLPFIPDYASHNAHVFYLVLPNESQRDKLIYTLRQVGIQAPFHYLALHKSMYFKDQYAGPPLPNSKRFTECLLRLPLFAGLSEKEQDYVIEQVFAFFNESP